MDFYSDHSSRKLMILGKGPSVGVGCTLLYMNQLGPAVDVWGINQNWRVPMIASAGPVVFELHPYADMGEEYWRDEQPLSLCPFPCVVYEARDEWKTSVTYPWESVASYTRSGYFVNTIAMQLSLAGMMGYREIHMYGCDFPLGDTEETRGTEYWIGWLNSRGVKVIVSASSILGRPGKISEDNYLKYNRFGKEELFFRKAIH